MDALKGEREDVHTALSNGVGHKYGKRCKEVEEVDLGVPTRGPGDPFPPAVSPASKTRKKKRLSASLLWDTDDWHPRYPYGRNAW